MNLPHARQDMTLNNSSALGNPEVKRLFMQAAMLTATYNIRMTPTLTIGGRYSLSPEVVAGNAASFIQLSNAMVSKYLQE